LAFSFPAFAQQDDGPMPPAARQEPVQPVPAQPSSAQNPASTPTTATVPQNLPASAATPGPKVEVPSGTTIPLVLHNGISTHSAKVGDPVYFETLFPIMIAGHVAIPAGSYVSGEITETKRAGRVKGQAELMIKLNTLILTNGYMVNLNAVPHNAGTGGGETVDNEGKVIGDSSKGADVGTIAKTTAAGAGIGGIATRSGEGTGIGAGVGAAAGLMAVLLTRGPDAELPRGTTVNVVLNRPVILDSEKDQFTGPGQASTLAGPSSREPQRSKDPF
jgi:type IV secretion system protein VirB10